MERVVPRVFQKSNDRENYEDLLLKAVINPDCPIPEPKDKGSEEWREWFVNRTAWAYDQRENFCLECCHAVFYAETKFRCREKITIEEAANQKICRGFQQK